MSLPLYAKSYGVVVGVALTGDAEWHGAVRAVYKDAHTFIRTAEFSNTFTQGGLNLGVQLYTRMYLLESFTMTQKLLAAFEEDKAKCDSVLSIYDSILNDPKVEGTIKSLISLKKPGVEKKKEILTEGIAEANNVISLYPSLISIINNMVDKMDRKGKSFRWH